MLFVFKKFSLKMIFLTLFLCTITTIKPEDYYINGYCDAASQTCQESNKYIFYEVNQPEGFNLRRDVYMRFAIMLSEGRKVNNWNLVLPPWHNLYHWRTDSDPIPWSRFFELQSLKNFAPVVELHEVVSEENSKNFIFDRLYVLENYDDAFEGGEFKEKWEIVDCDDEYYWVHGKISAREIVCVMFQGRISKLWELIALHPTDKYVMFYHGEIPLHDHYGDKIFWDCRKSMKFNDELVATAKKFISEELLCNTDKCSNYLSIHWRRQDFAISRKKDVPSIRGTVEQINDAILKYDPRIVVIFVATDAGLLELSELTEQLFNVGYEVHSYRPSELEVEEFKDGGVAIIEQIICSHAAYFIGTHESTFSFRIQEEREILGFDSSTTFNRFCSDTHRCSKPSKWTIIN